MKNIKYKVAGLFCLLAVPLFSTDSFALSMEIRPEFHHEVINSTLNLVHWWIDVDVAKQSGIQNIPRAQLIVDILSRGAQIDQIELPVSDTALTACLNASVTHCTVGQINLPIEDALLACEIQVSLQEPSAGNIAPVATRQWGDCTPDAGPMTAAVDLRWNTNSALQINPLPVPSNPPSLGASQTIEMQLMNSGTAALTVSLNTLAVGYDNQNEVIWSSLSTTQPPIAPQSTFNVAFPDSIAPWQWHRLCQVQLSIDPRDSVLTNSDSVRDITIPTGLCEADPINTPANRPDLTPTLSWTGRTLTAQIFNIGTVAAPMPAIKNIDYRFELYDSSTHILRTDNGELKQSIPGYGGEASTSWLISPNDGATACKAVFIIDPLGHLIDSNPANNTATLDHCKN